ncbi:MAG: hypothetical protein LIV24_02800, partial [Eubacterium sp.]|nr:hypothetical protein [Eubacterium sp.]
DIYNGYLTLSFASSITPRKNQCFALTIVNLSSETDAISWGSRLCYITSEYKGQRTINGIEQAGDTLIRVYQASGCQSRRQ